MSRKTVTGMIALLWCVWLAGISAAQDQTPLVALTPLDGDAVLTPGAAGAWDAVSVRFPHIVFHDGLYTLFYGTFQDFDAPVAIGYATSEDGEHWTKFEDNPILSGDGSGFDAVGVTRPVVSVDDDGTWIMYYNGIGEAGQVFGTGIGRATASSPEGPWTREEAPVLESGAARAWDAGFLFPDSVVHDGDTYVMYYSSGFSVGRATSEDGISWTKDADPVLTPASGQWDSAIAWGSDVKLTDNGWEMFYYGAKTRNGGPGIDVGYATSDDGITWERSPASVIDLASEQAFFPTFMIEPDGTYRVYYAVARNSAYTEFHLATGTITREN